MKKKRIDWQGYTTSVYEDNTSPEIRAALPKTAAKVPAAGEPQAIARALEQCYASVSSIDDGRYYALHQALGRAARVVVTQVADVEDLWQEEVVRLLAGKRARDWRAYIHLLNRRRLEAI